MNHSRFESRFKATSTRNASRHHRTEGKSPFNSIFTIHGNSALMQKIPTRWSAFFLFFRVLFSAAKTKTTIAGPIIVSSNKCNATAVLLQCQWQWLFLVCIFPSLETRSRPCRMQHFPRLSGSHRIARRAMASKPTDRSTDWHCSRPGAEQSAAEAQRK